MRWNGILLNNKEEQNKFSLAARLEIASNEEMPMEINPVC